MDVCKGLNSIAEMARMPENAPISSPLLPRRLGRNDVVATDAPFPFQHAKEHPDLDPIFDPDSMIVQSSSDNVRAVLSLSELFRPSSDNMQVAVELTAVELSNAVATLTELRHTAATKKP